MSQPADTQEVKYHAVIKLRKFEGESTDPKDLREVITIEDATMDADGNILDGKISLVEYFDGNGEFARSEVPNHEGA